MLCVAPLTLGLGTADQALPSQDSVRVSEVAPVSEYPTATQFVELVQETPFRMFWVAPLTLGLGTISYGIGAAPASMFCSTALPIDPTMQNKHAGTINRMIRKTFSN